MILLRYWLVRAFTKSARILLGFMIVTFNTALAAASTLMAIAFGLSTWDRWLRHRRPHELAWTIAMGLFALAALALWWAEARGWSSASFRVFFAIGAVINVPWLALGTVYLLAGPRIGAIVSRFILAFSAFAVGVVFTAPMRIAIAPQGLPTGKEVFGPLPRILAVVGSSVPAIVIFGGALWSTWRILRGASPALATAAVRHIYSPRLLALGNILIACGAIVLSLSGMFSGRLGADRSFALSLLVGITILFIGFLVASNATKSSSDVR